MPKKEKSKIISTEKKGNLPERKEMIPWKLNEPFYTTDIWLANGAAYALYRIPPELCTLFEITGSKTIIKTLDDYNENLNEIVLIRDIPLAILIQELMHLCEVLWKKIHLEEPAQIALLSSYKYEILWLAENLVPFFQEGLISKRDWPNTLEKLEDCLSVLKIKFEFRIYTAFGLMDPRKNEPLNDHDLDLTKK